MGRISRHRRMIRAELSRAPVTAADLGGIGGSTGANWLGAIPLIEAIFAAGPIAGALSAPPCAHFHHILWLYVLPAQSPWI